MVISLPKSYVYSKGNHSSIIQPHLGAGKHTTPTGSNVVFHAKLGIIYMWNLQYAWSQTQLSTILCQGNWSLDHVWLPYPPSFKEMVCTTTGWENISISLISVTTSVLLLEHNLSESLLQYNVAHRSILPLYSSGYQFTSDWTGFKTQHSTLLLPQDVIQLYQAWLHVGQHHNNGSCVTSVTVSIVLTVHVICSTIRTSMHKCSQYLTSYSPRELLGDPKNQHLRKWTEILG